MEMGFDKKIANRIKRGYIERDKIYNNQFKKEKIHLNISKSDVVYLKNKYISGYGLKILARKIGVTYTQIRRLFCLLNISINHGQNIVTNKLKKFRSIKAKKEGLFNNWPSKWKGYSRGVQGYYTTVNNEFVWLRSAYEYIFAKWLDKQNIDWKIEHKDFVLTNGESYRPDFFIFNNKKLESIIEIKGYFKDRVYKVDLLRKQLPEIKVILIDNIEPYIDKDSSYNREIKKWKKERLTKLKLEKLQ